MGVGFGRTGTASLKAALEELGMGPCYHMSEVIGQPWRARGWLEAAAGRPDWAGVFAGYPSAVDWPTAAFWRELVAEYPQARVVLTMRDPDRWYDSMCATILHAWRQRRARTGPPPEPLRDFEAMTQAVVAQGVFGGRAEDRGHAIEVYERHIAEVRATVPADRLLVFEITEGWRPLCDFLGLPVPAQPFPRRNDVSQFHQGQPET